MSEPESRFTHGGGPVLGAVLAALASAIASIWRTVSRRRHLREEREIAERRHREAVEAQLAQARELAVLQVQAGRVETALIESRHANEKLHGLLLELLRDGGLRLLEQGVEATAAGRPRLTGRHIRPTQQEIDDAALAAGDAVPRLEADPADTDEHGEPSGRRRR